MEVKIYIGNNDTLVGKLVNNKYDFKSNVIVHT